MGLKRALWRSTFLGRTIDTIKNINEEGDIVDGIKRTFKEDLTEDSPVGKAIYDSGKYNGKLEGYVEASDEYEKKLIAQADEFLKQTRDFRAERDAYEKLLNEYEAKIDELEAKVNRTQIENDLLNQLLRKEHELRKLNRQ